MAIVLAVPAPAGETRTWTNLKGQEITAELVRVDGEKVVLRMDGGRQVTIAVNTLSESDQQYVKEAGSLAKVSEDSPAKLDASAKKVRIDPKTITKRSDKFEFAGSNTELEFDIIESPHFLVMTSGRADGKDTAELAERLYHEMSVQHPGFGAKWGNERMAVFICGEDTDYEQLGEYHQAELVKAGRDKEAQNSKLAWPNTAGANLKLDAELRKKYGVKTDARAFKAYDRVLWKRGVWNPFPTHCLAGDMLRELIGGVRKAGTEGSEGTEGRFSLLVGQSYFKEIELCEETVTKMIKADAYVNDELTKAGGFEDGTKWAKTLRDLVKKEKVKPSLAVVHAVKDVGGLTPELTVSMYGLARYMQSTPERLGKFSGLMEGVKTGGVFPGPEEIATAFGFADVAAFDADWTEYLKSKDFD